MKTLRVYGASDDLIEAEGLPGCDEFNCYSNHPYKGVLKVRSSEGGLNIHVVYDGGWAFAITTNDGDCDNFPDWPIRRSWGDDVSYSETVEIQCPDDATVVFVKR